MAGDIIDFQLGKIAKVNADKTINIKDFRTGGEVYRDIALEPTAGDQQIPIEGQHILFCTVSTPHAQHIVKAVQIYSSKDADQDLVLSSPIDLEPGEKKLVSQTGSTVYVGNGGLQLSSGGQSYTVIDEDQLTQVVANKLQIVTRGGFLINEEDGVLTITKGTVTKTNTKYAVEEAQLTITTDGTSLDITGADTTVNVNCKEIKLNGDTPIARQDDAIEIELSLLPTEDTPSPQGGTLASAILTTTLGSPNTWQPGSTVTLKGRIVQGSSTVKSG